MPKIGRLTRKSARGERPEPSHGERVGTGLANEPGRASRGEDPAKAPGQAREPSGLVHQSAGHLEVLGGHWEILNRSDVSLDDVPQKGRCGHGGRVGVKVRR